MRGNRRGVGGVCPARRRVGTGGCRRMRAVPVPDYGVPVTSRAMSVADCAVRTVPADAVAMTGSPRRST